MGGVYWSMSRESSMMIWQIQEKFFLFDRLNTVHQSVMFPRIYFFHWCAVQLFFQSTVFLKRRGKRRRREKSSRLCDDWFLICITVLINVKMFSSDLLNDFTYSRRSSSLASSFEPIMKSLLVSFHLIDYLTTITHRSNLGLFLFNSHSFFFEHRCFSIWSSKIVHWSIAEREKEKNWPFSSYHHHHYHHHRRRRFRSVNIFFSYAK